MKQGINKVIIMGNIGRDPEVKYMTSGEAVANFSIATSESWKDKSGEKQEKTEWHNIVAYRKLAEIIGEYVKKGSKVYIEGKLQTRKWQDKEGKDRYTTEIIADEMQILSKLERSNDGEFEAGPMSNPLTSDARIPAPNRSPDNPKATFQAPAMTDDFDDDIPF